MKRDLITILWTFFFLSIWINKGISQEPIVYWSFNENTGEIVLDATKQGHDGKITGAQWGTGKFDAGMEFNGKGDFIEIDDHQNLNFGPKDSLTIAAWAKYSKNTPKGEPSWIVGKGGQLPAHYIFGYHQTPQSLRLKLDDGGTDLKLDANMDILDDTWRHYATVRDKSKGEARLYIDGKLVASQNDGTQDTTNNAPLHIGQRGDGTQWMNGAIDELVIFREALEADGIQQIMDGSLLKRFLAVNSRGKLATAWCAIKTQQQKY